MSPSQHEHLGNRCTCRGGRLPIPSMEQKTSKSDLAGAKQTIDVNPTVPECRLISLSTVFPNPKEPGLGLFVRSRLLEASRWGCWMVVAPVALADYSCGLRGLFRNRRIPAARKEDAVKVLHPRWVYPPLGGVLNGPLLGLQLIPFLRKVRRGFHFDIIDAHFAHPEGVAAAILSRWFCCPYSITMRGNETRHGQSSFCRWGMAWALRNADAVITVSESLRQYAISLGVKPDRVKTIPNGVDTGLFFPRGRDVCRRKHGISAEAKVVLSAGALIERKGHHRVIEALRRIAEGESKLQLLIAGGPGREGRFEQSIRKVAGRCGMNDHVRFLGQLSPLEMAEMMSAADVLCLASTREGWPNVVHEAMACGTPVVATSVGGIPDLVPSDRYGLVVPVDDSQRLREALEDALRRSWDRTDIQQWAHSRSWNQVGRETFEQLCHAIEEWGRNKEEYRR